MTSDDERGRVPVGGTSALRPSSRQPLALSALVLATAIWGATFLLVKNVVAVMPSMLFLSYRFVVAALVLFALRPRAVLACEATTIRRGFALGIVASAGFVFQTVGLEHTSAAISGFITGLQVVFTPIMAWALVRHRATSAQLAAVGLATVGLAFMSLRGVELGLGAVLTLACAVFFALQIVLLSSWSTRENAYALTFVQISTVAVSSTLSAAATGFGLPPNAGAWIRIVAMGVFATAFALVVQSWAQSRISATRAAIAYTLEPAFAALFAFWGGEHVGLAVLGGGAFVVVAMGLSELAPQPVAPRPAMQEFSEE